MYCTVHKPTKITWSITLAPYFLSTFTHKLCQRKRRAPFCVLPKCIPTIHRTWLKLVRLYHGETVNESGVLDTLSRASPLCWIPHTSQISLTFGVLFGVPCLSNNCRLYITWSAVHSEIIEFKCTHTRRPAQGPVVHALPWVGSIWSGWSGEFVYTFLSTSNKGLLKLVWRTFL